MGRDRLNLLTCEAEGRRVLHLLLVHFRPELLGDGGHRLALPHLFIRTHTHDRFSATCQRLNGFECFGCLIMMKAVSTVNVRTSFVFHPSATAAPRA